MDFYEKTLSSDMIFKGRVLNLRVDEVLLPDGNIGQREIVEHNGGVAVLAVMDKKIILVRQFRKPHDEVLYELPAGKLEPGEDPYECAIREMEEETGMIPENLKLMLTIYTTPGFSSEKLYIYKADEFKQGEICRDKDEFMDVSHFDIEEVTAMIMNNSIKDAKTICGILMYLQLTS